MKSALYIYAGEEAPFLGALLGFRPGIDIQTIRLAQFLAADYELDPDVAHLVVSAPLAGIKAVIEIALKRDISLGILPEKHQKQLSRYLNVSETLEERVALALQKNPPAIDVIRCNGEIVLFNASIGRVASSQGDDAPNKSSLLGDIFSNLRRLRLVGFKVVLPEKKPIDTAASGCAIVVPEVKGVLSNVIAGDCSMVDGMIALLIISPTSLLGHMRLLLGLLVGNVTSRKLPDTLGYIKSPALSIETSKALPVVIDGQAYGTTPADCRVQPRALKVNRAVALGEAPQGEATERIDVRNLPMGAEKIKAMKKNPPFFPYASEERFKELFIMLRHDAKNHVSFRVLMFLSTMLATFGLFLNSSSVVIGAMLLAPLMAPIVSFSMGMLRSDRQLALDSARTVVVGILFALTASALVTLVLPGSLITSEMSARLNPSLLDLAVAIFAGVAAAYTKTDKKLMSGLAGVAIAVALVPPLSVAGVGIARGDLEIFSQAFLLFTTNLMGITASAALTFRVLGYSPAIKARKSFMYVLLVLALISIPLYFSYDSIVQSLKTDLAWKRERFLVNGKYLIVKHAIHYEKDDFRVVEMDIYARENLTREELNAFKERFEEEGPAKRLKIRVNLTYIL